MKLVKLSLAAALAAGALATAASAAPFEEVIKDVDVSGFTRVRYTHDRKIRPTSEDSSKKNDSKWNYKAILNFKTKIDDNFFGVVSLRYGSDDIGSGDVASETSNTKSNIEVYQAYLGYNIGNTSVLVGRQVVGTFFTDDMVGSGIKVLNTDIEGLTLAALWMDSLERDPDIGSWQPLPPVGGKEINDHNLYGVAAIGSYDPISFQVWYAVLQDVTNLFAVELSGNVDVTDDFNLGLKGQYAFADLDNDYKLIGGDDSKFYAGELSTKISAFDLSAGYLNFSTDKNKVSLSSFEDSGSFIKPGEELLDYSFYEGKNKYWFVTGGFTINDQVRIGADYVKGDQEYLGDKIKKSEIVARIDYAYSKKLNFKTWYSRAEEKNGDEKNKNDRIRFEAKYSF